MQLVLLQVDFSYPNLLDSIRQMDDPSTPNIIIPSAGVHIVLPEFLCPSENGLLIPKTKVVPFFLIFFQDGRVLFVLPWQGKTLAGTTDGPSQLSETPRAQEQDVDFILQALVDYLEYPVSKADVLAAWSGEL
jgi:glycerol-3-phosphate dehydrogenase